MDARVMRILAGILLLFAALLVAGYVFTPRPERVPPVDKEEIARERAADRREATAAFADPVAPTPQDVAEFRPVFDALGKAMGREDAAAVTRAFDVPRMIREMERTGGFDAVPAANRREFARGAETGLRETLGKSLVANEFKWVAAELRRVRWSPDRSEAVVIVVHRMEDEEYVVKVRWWLARRPDGWKVYDFEELGIGNRITHLFGLILTPQALTELMANPDRFREQAAGIREALVALSARLDAGAADAALARVRGAWLPGPVAAMRDLAEGMLALLNEDPDTALVWFGKVELVLPGMPYLKLGRAVAYNLAGEHEKALGYARAYLAELGPDYPGLLQEATALSALMRNPEAAVAARAALAESPDAADAFELLLRVLPADGKGEIGTHLAKAKKPDVAFDHLLGEARREKDRAGTAALLAWLKKTRPDDPRWVCEEIREKVIGEKFADAAAQLRAALPAAKTDAAHGSILSAYLDAMDDEERHAEAYAAVPDAHAVPAFRFLAQLFEFRIIAPRDAPDKAKEPRERLTGLIAAHRKRDPKDPALWFYDAALLQAAGELDKAEKLFAEGQAVMAKSPKVPAVDEDDDEWDEDRFRSRRVDCLYAAKKGLRAYETVGPADATFRQLAFRYRGDADTDGLTNLVAAHRAKEPAAAALAYWDGEVKFLRKEYGRAAADYRAYRKAAGEKGEYLWSANDRLVRCELRAGDAAAVARAADEVGRDKLGPELKLAVVAAGGDADALDAALAEHLKSFRALYGAYGDEDFVRLFADPKFAELRKKHPDPRPKGDGPKT